MDYTCTLIECTCLIVYDETMIRTLINTMNIRLLLVIIDTLLSLALFAQITFPKLSNHTFAIDIRADYSYNVVVVVRAD